MSDYDERPDNQHDLEDMRGEMSAGDWADYCEDNEQAAALRAWSSREHGQCALVAGALVCVPLVMAALWMT